MTPNKIALQVTYGPVVIGPSIDPRQVDTSRPFLAVQEFTLQIRPCYKQHAADCYRNGKLFGDWYAPTMAKQSEMLFACVTVYQYWEFLHEHVYNN